MGGYSRRNRKAGNGNEGQNLTLSLLQDRIKRDALAYKSEFLAQVRHFESVLELLLLNPAKASKQFDEQVMFLAHLIDLLQQKKHLLHAGTRKVLVQALVMLRNRNQYELLDALPLHFELLALDDKTVRQLVHTHIIKDVLRMNQNTQDMVQNKKLQHFLFQQLEVNGNSGKQLPPAGRGKKSEQGALGSNQVTAARKALVILISLYKKNVWTGAAVVNAIAGCCEHSDLHVAKAAANFLLGNMHLIAEDDDDSDDEENKKTIGDVSKKVLGIKRFAKSGQKKKKMEKAKKKAIKAVNGKKSSKSGLESKECFAAIDLLHDPQKTAEKLLVRVMRAHENYAFRLLLLQLCSRLMGRHKLILPNFYPYIQKYLQPTQREVTTVLACLAQSCHDLVPSEALRPAVSHVFKSFVNETNAPEVITVGINSLREVACRVPSALLEEEVHDLCSFRKYKHKGVRVGVKGLVNMYRELNPEFLQKQFRGKEASEAIARGELNFAEGVTAESLFGQGMELLAARKLRKEEKKREREERGGGSGSDEDGDLDWDDIEEISDPEEEASDEEEVSDDEDASDAEEAKVAGAKENKSAKKKSARKSASSSEDGRRKSAADTGSDEEADDEEEQSDLEEEVSDLEEGSDAGSSTDCEEAASGSDERNSSGSDRESDSEQEDAGEERGRKRGPKLSKATLKRRKLAEKREIAEELKQKRAEIKSTARDMMSEQILQPEDFKKMRKLQAARAMEMQLGTSSKKTEKSTTLKRNQRGKVRDPYEFSSSDDDSDKDGDKSGSGSDGGSDSDSDSLLDEEAKAKKAKARASKKVYNDLDFIDPSKLNGHTRKKHDKHTRMQSVLKGREGRDKFGGGKSGRTGGSTNKEKRRNKPMLMQIQSKQVRVKKNGQKATAKLANLRKHIGNLKKAGKHQKRRR
eukprot:g1697.t1